MKRIPFGNIQEIERSYDRFCDKLLADKEEEETAEIQRENRLERQIAQAEEEKLDI